MKLNATISVFRDTVYIRILKEFVITAEALLIKFSLASFLWHLDQSYS